MRLSHLAAACAVLVAAAPAAHAAKPAAAAQPKAEKTWIAICFGQDAQYTQTINGPGYFHLGTGQRTYQTQKLVQSFFDGNIVCGTPDPKAGRADSAVAEVCANLKDKTVSVMSLSTAETTRVTPQNAVVFCKARIDVLD